MSHVPFAFQRFHVHHGRAAMKVGTDGVLLGAWFQPTVHHQIADVGSGSGLVGMMLAQRFDDSHVTLIDSNEDAFHDSNKTVQDGPFAHRMQVVHADFVVEKFNQQWDAIVSNPPFFQGDLPAHDWGRRLARQGDTLHPHSFFERCARWGKPQVEVGVIVSAEGLRAWLAAASSFQFGLVQGVMVSSLPHKSPHRVLLHWKKDCTAQERWSEAYIEESRGVRSNWYAQLTQEFYLR